jgi:hypothetical protein
MKKIITILNQYLSHFWFTILALMIGCLSVVQFSDLAYSVDYWEINKLSYIAYIFGVSLLYFFLPLGIISLIIALAVWLKFKNENSYQGLVALILIILANALIFLFITKLSIIGSNISINHNINEPMFNYRNTPTEISK